MVRIMDEKVIYSDDAKSTVAIATALQPLLLHALTAKINPYMCTKLLTFFNQTLFAHQGVANVHSVRAIMGRNHGCVHSAMLSS